jgi:hypothetical protein
MQSMPINPAAPIILLYINAKDRVLIWATVVYAIPVAVN